VTRSRPLAAVTLSVLLALAGCGAASDSPSPAPDATSTSVPSPAPTATPAPSPTPPSTATASPTPDDPDGDGLPADEEAAYGTDPTLADTDGDGLDDRLEVRGHPKLPGADPLHRDVYVELDYQEGLRPNASALAPLVDYYASAPLSNPDGEDGITLHIRVDDAVGPQESVRFGQHLSRYPDGPDEGRWYYYGVVVARAETASGRPVSGVSDGIGTFLLTPQPTPARNRSLLAHELGHTLGIPAFARGVDSTNIPYDQYPSVMNYNAPRTTVRFSNGTNSPNDLDDWALVERGVRVLPVKLRSGS
jgi:hypothetical protein